MPVNTNGGLIGEAYIHGMNLLTEAVRQIRGTAVNQVNGANRVLMSSGRGACILGRDTRGQARMRPWVAEPRGYSDLDISDGDLYTVY
jgi:hypothetical protein